MLLWQSTEESTILLSHQKNMQIPKVNTVLHWAHLFVCCSLFTLMVSVNWVPQPSKEFSAQWSNKQCNFLGFICSSKKTQQCDWKIQRKWSRQSRWNKDSKWEKKIKSKWLAEIELVISINSKVLASFCQPHLIVGQQGRFLQASL